MPGSTNQALRAARDVMLALVLISCGADKTENNPGPANGGAGGIAGSQTGGDGAGGTRAGGASAGRGGTGGATAGASSGAVGGVGGDAGEAGADAGGVAGDAGQAGSGAGAIGGDGGSAGGAGGSGGSAGADPGVPVVSGTRLKAKYVSGPDGSRIYRRGRLFDSELDVDCAFRIAADGVLRCLPTRHPASGAQVFFLNDDCTNPTVWFLPPPDGCSVDLPEYVDNPEPPPYCGVDGAAELVLHVYPIGSLIAPPTGTVYHETESGCLPDSPPSNRVVYSLGAEVPAASFVAGSKELAP